MFIMKKILLTLVLSLIAASLNAQVSGESVYKVGTDLKDALSDTALFVMPSFGEGKIFFNDGRISTARFNISNINQKINFIDMRGDTLEMVNDADVKYAILSNRTFFKTKFGYSQVLSYDKDVYFTILKDVTVQAMQAMTSYGRIPASSTATHVNSINLSGTTAPRDKRELDVKYDMKIRVVLIKGDKAYLSSRKAFQKVFPERKDEIDALAKQLKTDFGDVQGCFDLYSALIER